jgi:hypothetical protein
MSTGFQLGFLTVLLAVKHNELRLAMEIRYVAAFVVGDLSYVRSQMNIKASPMSRPYLQHRGVGNPAKQGYDMPSAWYSTGARPGCNPGQDAAGMEDLQVRILLGGNGMSQPTGPEICALIH